MDNSQLESCSQQLHCLHCSKTPVRYFNSTQKLFLCTNCIDFYAFEENIPLSAALFKNLQLIENRLHQQSRHLQATFKKSFDEPISLLLQLKGQILSKISLLQQQTLDSFRGQVSQLGCKSSQSWEEYFCRLALLGKKIETVYREGEVDIQMRLMSLNKMIEQSNFKAHQYVLELTQRVFAQLKQNISPGSLFQLPASLAPRSLTEVPLPAQHISSLRELRLCLKEVELQVKQPNSYNPFTALSDSLFKLTNSKHALHDQLKRVRSQQPAAARPALLLEEKVQDSNSLLESLIQLRANPRARATTEAAEVSKQSQSVVELLECKGALTLKMQLLAEASFMAVTKGGVIYFGAKNLKESSLKDGWSRSIGEFDLGGIVVTGQGEVVVAANRVNELLHYSSNGLVTFRSQRKLKTVIALSINSKDQIFMVFANYSIKRVNSTGDSKYLSVSLQQPVSVVDFDEFLVVEDKATQRLYRVDQDKVTHLEFVVEGVSYSAQRLCQTGLRSFACYIPKAGRIAFVKVAGSELKGRSWPSKQFDAACQHQGSLLCVCRFQIRTAQLSE